MKQKTFEDGVRAKGIFRINIHEKKNGRDRVVGDSGWVYNTITNAGYSNFILGPMISDAASSKIAYAALGTGTAPATNATGLAGELAQVTNNRFGVTGAITGTKSLQFTGSIASGILTATAAIDNIGLFASSNVTAGTIACGQTYATSTLQTNQSVSLTYSLTFS